MSAKWIRSQRWDDEHLTGVLWPLKPLLRWFSYISTAVILLSFVAFYGVLASVPIGIIALGPTWLLYGLTALACVGLVGVLPVWLATRSMRAAGASPARRAVVGTLGLLILGTAGAYAWAALVWPHLRWDPAHGTGVRLFAEFVDRYKAVQFRRLPGVEMSELEFYSWWPLTLALVLFVINLVVATVRRIEFNFPRVGVLMVHTGIVTIALGSVYYAGHKQEGDVLLRAGGIDEAGKPVDGPPETGFFDNTRVALWVTAPGAAGWEQRPLEGVPRYNDYNLAAVPGAPEPPAGVKDFGPISVEPATPPPGATPLVDPDVRFRVVGYASFAELRETWAKGSGGAGGKGTRVRVVEAAATQSADPGKPPPSIRWTLAPDVPAERLQVGEGVGVEYTIGMPAERWAALAADLPKGTTHALVVEVPGADGGKGFRDVYAVSPGADVQVGNTGWSLRVKELSAQPPFPIVTRGYKGATSSVAVVHVTPPPRADGTRPGAFDRWVYHRFPEISQDLLEELNERGMPKRRDADPAIRIWYVDATLFNLYVDERPDGTARMLVRFPGDAPAASGRATVIDPLPDGQPAPIAPSMTARIAERMDDALKVEVPVIVPEAQRDRQRIGNHQAAAVAVEVSWGKGGLDQRRVAWVPFTQYMNVQGEGGLSPRTFALDGERTVQVVFGRVRHEFWPPMQVSLHDFEMIPYPHSDTPRDYRSEVVVSTRWGEVFRDEVRSTSLNEPLLVRTPYVPPEGMPVLGRAVGRLLSVVAPNQYKFSQAGWDQSGWRETAAAAERGEIKRPVARFTILGVGTNPGIYIIAAGAVLMSVGIPWAFYLKPWLVKREARRLRERLEREGKGPKARGGRPGPSANGTHAARGTRTGTEP